MRNEDQKTTNEEERPTRASASPKKELGLRALWYTSTETHQVVEIQIVASTKFETPIYYLISLTTTSWAGVYFIVVSILFLQNLDVI